MNSILIESNRVIADSRLLNQKSVGKSSQTSDIHTLKQSTASWSTTIDSGIELRKGDQISLQAASLNINGAGSGNFQQFNGIVDVPDGDGVFRKDNAVDIELAYYTTNTCEFNFPLPSGKHTVEYNTRLQHDMGAPCLTGRNIWHINFGFINMRPPLFNITPFNKLNYFFEKNTRSGGPAANKQNVGGYYFVGMDTNVLIPGLGAPPTHDPSASPVFCQNEANAAAFMNWTAMTPFQSIPGVQFGQPKGPVLPLDSAKDRDTSEPTTISSVNLNTETRNIYTNSGFFENGKNGGANPQMIRIGNIFSVPQVEGKGGISTRVYLCGDFGEWSESPFFYKALKAKEAPTFKGSMYNYQPNGRKLYRPRKDFKKYYCRGPFYDFSFNTLLKLDGTANVGDPSMNGMVNLRTHGRNDAYWDYQTQKVKVRLQTGNIAPTRIGEIITETFKGKYGDADEPGAEFWKQESWTPVAQQERSNKPGGFLPTSIGNISSKAYSTFPTFAGSLMEAQNNISPDNLGDDYGWDMLTNENIKDYDTLTPGDTIAEGQFYNVNQAKMQYWSNQLCGNPFEWRGVTKIVPMLQYRPFCDTTIAAQGANWNYQHQSVYTGTTAINQGSNEFINLNRRVAANGSAVQMDIGEYGDLPCLLERPRAGRSTIKDKPYQGLWWITDGTGSGTSTGGVTGPHRLQNKPYGQWYPDASNVYETLAPEKYDIILTNIIFDGQVSNEIWNDLATDIKGHKETTTGNDTLTSQSKEFFDNTFVNWKIGRLDDQKGFPSQYIDEGFSLRKNKSGQKGVAQYLPNILMTNKLFKNRTDAGWEFVPYLRGNIDEFLTNSSLKDPATQRPPSTAQGTYTMNPTRMGEYKSDGTYTALLNPNTFFVDAPVPSNQYAENQFGLPCWSFFKGEYTKDIEDRTGFEKVSERILHGFRYLPTSGDKNGTLYTAANALGDNLGESAFALTVSATSTLT